MGFAGQKTLGIGGDEHHRDLERLQEFVDRVEAQLPSASWTFGQDQGRALAAATDLELAAEFGIRFPVGGLLIFPFAVWSGLAAVLSHPILSHGVSLGCSCVRQAICGKVLNRKFLDRRFLRNFLRKFSLGRIEAGITIRCRGFERKRCGRNWRIAALAGHAAAGERERATQQGNNS